MAKTARSRATGASPGEEAWTLLRGLLAYERRRFAAVAAEFDLHPAQAGALLHLEADAPRPMHDLAATLACDNSNVTGIVDRLESRGLVERLTYAGDRRIKLVALTQLGVETRQRVHSRLARPPSAIDRLSTRDQRLLRDLLRRGLES